MNLFKNVHESWIPLLHSLAYDEPMVSFLDSLQEKSIQPPLALIFKVFEMPVQDIKVVILGQNPYPRPGTAVGRAFAIPKENKKMPAVLSFIKKETLNSKELCSADLNWQTLDHWTKQGIFLLNTALTVETDGASHSDEWRHFTERVVAFISKEKPCVWMLWGRAKDKWLFIDNSFVMDQYSRENIEHIPVDPEYNYVVTGEYPTAGEGFAKDGFFMVNEILSKKSLTKIIW